MAYTPTEWSRGDVVTSEKLNKLEQGVAEAGGGSGGGILVAHLDTTTYAIDKTWQEVHDAMADGIIVLIPFVEDGFAFNYIAVSAVIQDGEYRIECDVSGKILLVTDNANGYPVLS